jgi:hypothetical protein
MATLNPISIPAFAPEGSVNSPSRPVQGIVKARTITPSDTVDLPEHCRWIKCGTTGTIAFIGWDGVTVSDPGHYTSGVWHPVYATRILATGTTATQIMWGN